MIRVRVDDFPHTSKREPQHTHAAFREFHRELSAGIGGKRYLLGVVPKQCSPEDLLLIRNETDCVIGMHGIVHDERLLDIHQNEFPAYLPRKAVREQLTEAATALQAALGRKVEIYMPPRNRIDRRTRDEMHNSGFYAYTTGPETPEEFRTGPQVDAFYIDSQPPHEYGRTDELLARRSHEELLRGDHVLTLHWTWEVNIGLHHLRKFFEQFSDKSVFEHFDE